MQTDDPLPRLAARFEAFAAHECPEEPLYIALCRIAARQPEVLELLLAAPETQQKPNLLLAAVQERLLADADADDGAAADPLAAYFASVGGSRAPDAELAPQFLRFVRQQAEPLRERIATGRTQTNEIGRCAVLWPALAAIAQRRGPAPLALFDFGCSAGLNLEVDRYRCRYESAQGAFEIGPAEPPASPLLSCRLLGAPPPAALWRTTWQLADRLGVDLAPVDLRDDAALRWLRACVWPSDTPRMRRLQQAAALARPARRELRASEDGLGELSAWLDRLPPGVTPVVFNSWVLAYFTPPALAAHTARLRALVQQRGLVWLSAEDAARTAAVTGQPPPAGVDALSAEARAEPGSHTWWALTEPGTSGPNSEPTTSLLARSHPHGRWLQWL